MRNLSKRKRKSSNHNAYDITQWLNNNDNKQNARAMTVEALWNGLTGTWILSSSVAQWIRISLIVSWITVRSYLSNRLHFGFMLKGPCDNKFGHAVRSARMSERCERTSKWMSERPITNLPITGNFESLWDGRTYGWTGGRTDGPSYRDVWTHLKSSVSSDSMPDSNEKKRQR